MCSVIDMWNNILFKNDILYFLGFLLISFMIIHSQILKEYKKYEKQLFKEQYFHNYQHLYETNNKFRSKNGYKNVSLLQSMELRVKDEPFWYNDLRSQKLDFVFVSLFVLSSAGNFQKREYLRSEYNAFFKIHILNEQYYPRNSVAKLTFLVGNSRNKTTEILLRKECEKYGDILRLDIEESYKNIVYKVLNGFASAAKISRQVSNSYLSTLNPERQIYSATRNKIQLNETHINPTKTIGAKDHRILRTVNLDKLEWIVKVDDDMKVNYAELMSNLRNQTACRLSMENHCNMSILCSSVLQNNIPEWRNDSMTRKW